MSEELAFCEKCGKKLKVRANYSEPHSANDCIKVLQAQVAKLQAEVEEWHEQQRHVMDERCGDEEHCTCVPELRLEVERLREALDKINDWSKAYPLDLFPEPDFKQVRDLLAAGGIPIDVVSASNMRHVVEGVGKIAREALEGGEG